MRPFVGALAAVFLVVVGGLAVPTVAVPGVTVTAPANGATSLSRSVTVNGTASGSEGTWLQTTKADFDSGTKESLVSDSGGSLSLTDPTIYDNFNDNSIDPALWTKTDDGGMTTVEQNGTLHSWGTCNAAPYWNGYGQVVSAKPITTAAVSASIKSFSGSGTGYASTIDLRTSDTIYMDIGTVVDDYKWGQAIKIQFQYSNGITTYLDAIGNTDTGPHTYGISVSGGRGSVYYDGTLLQNVQMPLSFTNPLAMITTSARINGDSVDATWDNVRTALTGGYMPSGNFTSRACDTLADGQVLKKISWSADVPSGTSVDVQVRSAQTSDMASPTAWVTVSNGQTAGLPAARRYLQYRLSLSTIDPRYTPVLKDITIAYEIPVTKVEVSIDERATWLAATGKEQWQILLSLPENATNVWVRVTDAAGETALMSITVNVDTTPPEGSMQINRGDRYADAREVTILLNATDHYGVASVLLSEKPDLSGASWRDYHPLIAYQLSNYDGLKTVYATFRDVNGLESGIVRASIFLDTSTPSGTVAINGGAEFTNDANVSLSFNASDSAGIAEVLVSNRSDFTGAQWAPYNASLCWTLIPGNGERAVFVKFRDPAKHESGASSDSISLDTIPPLAKVTINAGAPFTNSTNVTLALNATDNYRVDSVELSQDPLFAGAARQAYRTVMSYQLPPGDGPKTLYARALDAAGNAGPANLSSIILDSAPPVSAHGQLPAETEDPNITVSWAGSDATSGIKWFDVQFRDGSGAWTDWLAHTVLVNASFTGQPGHNYSFRTRALDNAGNQQDYPDGAGSSVYVMPKYVPVVSITSPRDGARLGGMVNIAGNAFHPDSRRSVLRVEARVDGGEWRPAAGTLDWKFRLDTTKLSDGAHAVEVRAFDGERYSAGAGSNFTVSNAKTATGMQPFLVLLLIVIAAVVAVGGGAAYAISRKKRRASPGAGAAETPGGRDVSAVAAYVASQSTDTWSPGAPPPLAPVIAPPMKKPAVTRVSVEELEGPPREEKTDEERRADEEALRENRIHRALTSLPRGLPSTLWGTDLEELAAKVAHGETRESPAGDRLVRIDNRWYYGDEKNLGLFMQKYEE